MPTLIHLIGQIVNFPIRLERFATYPATIVGQRSSLRLAVMRLPEIYCATRALSSCSKEAFEYAQRFSTVAIWPHPHLEDASHIRALRCLHKIAMGRLTYNVPDRQSPIGNTHINDCPCSVVGCIFLYVICMFIGDVDICPLNISGRSC
jgi:hypothetical protein